MGVVEGLLGFVLDSRSKQSTVVKPVVWEPGRGLPRRRTGSCRRSRRVVTRPASGAEHTPQSHAPPDPASERVSDLNMNVHAVANPVPNSPRYRGCGVSRALAHRRHRRHRRLATADVVDIRISADQRRGCSAQPLKWL